MAVLALERGARGKTRALGPAAILSGPPRGRGITKTHGDGQTCYYELTQWAS